MVGVISVVPMLSLLVVHFLTVATTLYIPTLKPIEISKIQRSYKNVLSVTNKTCSPSHDFTSVCDKDFNKSELFEFKMFGMINKTVFNKSNGNPTLPSNFPSSFPTLKIYSSYKNDSIQRSFG